MEKSLSKYSVQSLNRFEKWLLRFKAFPRAFKEASLLGKIALICELILPGSGTAILGGYEKGIISAGAYILVWFLGIYVGIQQATGVVNLNALSIVVFYLAIAIGIYFLYIANYDGTLKEVERLNRGEKYRVTSFIYQGAISLRQKVNKYINTYRDTYFKTDEKGRTMLLLGFFVMGIPQMAYSQVIKGIAYLAIEAGLIVYLCLSGFHDIGALCYLHSEYNRTFVYGILGFIALFALIFFYFSHLGSILFWVKEDVRKKRATFLNECASLVNEKFYVVGLIVPILGALLFTVVPILFMILTAFTNYSLKIVPGYENSVSMGGEIIWNGFTTFGRLLQRPDTLMDMLSVFGWTMVWALLATFTCYFGGLLLAMLLNKKAIYGKVVYRSLFVIAMAMPQFISLLVVKTMFENGGLVNTILYNMGIIDDLANSIEFWRDDFWGKFLIIVVNMWVGIPYYMLLMSGLLLNIPNDLYEAADIEGASRWTKFRTITFPQIFYMTTPTLITSFVSNINNFNVIWFLTGGGRVETGSTAGNSDILITWLYKLTFQASGQADYNLAAVIGIVMFILSASISLIVFTNSKSYNAEEEYR